MYSFHHNYRAGGSALYCSVVLALSSLEKLMILDMDIWICVLSTCLFNGHCSDELFDNIISSETNSEGESHKQ